MGRIYNHAYVTLVALAGDNAEYGLPGVDRRPARWTGTTQGLYLLNEKSPYPLLVRHSKWTTRGWTFQESMLSQRLLMFSDMGLFYECNGRHGYTDEEAGSVDTYYKAQIGLTNYRKLIYEYTSKDLTFESDILRAFTGILHAVYGTNHYFGIPFEEFTNALLWYTEDGKYPPRTTDGDVFPSWTWLSTRNTVKIDRDIWPDWKSSTASLAIWAIPSGNSFKCIPNISKKRHEVGEQDVKEHLQTELAVIIAWRAGCFPETFSAELGFNCAWRQYEDAINENWSSLADICDAAQGIDSRTLLIKNMKTKFPLYQRCQPGHTMVHTQSLHLRIQPVQHNPHSEYTQYGKLQEATGKVLGWIDEETANWDLIDLNTEYDVIALFLRCDADVSAFDPHVNGSAYAALKKSKFSYPVELIVSESTQLIVYLMVVKSEDGISRRVALAKSHFDVWIDAKPKFGTFTLA
ncbi:hypothetical protein MW887_002528 [Aspergillus wentii]|nr:hypothetical protein MW887_002528 [Aspergillus wentii]